MHDRAFRGRTSIWQTAMRFHVVAALFARWALSYCGLPRRYGLDDVRRTRCAELDRSSHASRRGVHRCQTAVSSWFHKSRGAKRIGGMTMRDRRCAAVEPNDGRAPTTFGLFGVTAMLMLATYALEDRPTYHKAQAAARTCARNANRGAGGRLRRRLPAGCTATPNCRCPASFTNERLMHHTPAVLDERGWQRAGAGRSTGRMTAWPGTRFVLLPDCDADGVLFGAHLRPYLGQTRAPNAPSIRLHS